MLNDDSLEAEFEKKLAEMGDEVARPELHGYSAEVAALHKVETALVELQRIVAKNLKIPLPKGPVFPAERFRERKDQAEIDGLFADIFAADPTVFGVPKQN